MRPYLIGGTIIIFLWIGWICLYIWVQNQPILMLVATLLLGTATLIGATLLGISMFLPGRAAPSRSDPAILLPVTNYPSGHPRCYTTDKNGNST
jgi:hypothetical protein